MRLRAVGDLVAHAWNQREMATVLQFRAEHARNAKENVSFDAPMIRVIPRRVLDHSNADGPELLSSPIGKTPLTLVSVRSTFDQSVTPNGMPDICMLIDLVVPHTPVSLPNLPNLEQETQGGPWLEEIC